MVELGLDVAPELLALVCASHDGTPAHLAAVTAVLHGVGLGPDDLRNTADLPLDATAAEAVLRGGGGRRPPPGRIRRTARLAARPPRGAD